MSMVILPTASYWRYTKDEAVAVAVAVAEDDAVSSPSVDAVGDIHVVQRDTPWCITHASSQPKNQVRIWFCGWELACVTHYGVSDYSGAGLDIFDH